jgi:hypothetical protein
MCTLCDKGFTSNEENTGCVGCGGGSFSNREGSACILCHAGSFSDLGATSCDLCEIGSYSKSDGTSHCSRCEAGTYQDSTGQSTCTYCPAGTYCPNKGNTHYLNCPFLFVAKADSSTCVPSLILVLFLVASLVLTILFSSFLFLAIRLYFLLRQARKMKRRRKLLTGDVDDSIMTAAEHNESDPLLRPAPGPVYSGF